MSKWCGNYIQVRAQKILAQEEQWITEQRGLFSQGRTLLIFDGDTASLEWIEFLVKKFLRVLIHGKRSSLLALASYLQALNFDVDNELLLFVGESSTVLSQAKVINKQYSFPEGLMLSSIDSSSGVNEVKAIQNLYITSGLAPLPESFIRGEKGQSHTIILKNSSQKIMGCATVKNLLDGGHPYKNSAMVLSVCLNSELRGMRISPLLNLAALKYGISQYCTRQMYEIVESSNIPSFRMNLRCSLSPHETEGFIFISVAKNLL